MRRRHREYVIQNDDRWISSIESAINAHLVSWGVEDKDNSSSSFEIDGKSCTDVCIEQAYKGNFHLYASIDGRDCKFIIGKNKPECYDSRDGIVESSGDDAQRFGCEISGEIEDI